MQIQSSAVIILITNEYVVHISYLSLNRLRLVEKNRSHSFDSIESGQITAV